MKIIKAEVQHITAIAPLFDQYRVFYGQPSDLSGAKAFIRDRVQMKESTIFIAYDDEQPVGFMQLYPLFTSIGMQRKYVLNDLFVIPSFRTQGVGKALMQQAIQFAKEERANQISLQTSIENHPAKALYERMGMQMDLEFDNYILRLV
ncbi:GNAT family N-acetyltransferase [Paenibacillus puldeungensis]|uniref:GNAT family N-acetyltransferase n=1 Tax=Paenibacillus puldeungensis TaxID=696536 RepID=A0ABW3S148_9BACL